MDHLHPGSASPKFKYQRFMGTVLESEQGCHMGLKPNEIIQGVPECGRREREPWGGIFSRNSTSPIQLWAEKPSGKSGQGAAFTPNNKTRRTLRLESAGKIKGILFTQQVGNSPS